MAIKETIDKSIEGLIEQLAAADAVEAARIRTRIDELTALKEEHTTT